MNSQQLQLVNFEQAKRLKQLGFDWETTKYFLNSGTVSTYFNIRLVNWNNHRRISAPSVALAIKWFRDVKKLPNCIDWIGGGEYVGGYLHPIYGWCNFLVMTGYEAAESALLDELLTIIEKENENI